MRQEINAAYSPPSGISCTVLVRVPASSHSIGVALFNPLPHFPKLIETSVAENARRIAETLSGTPVGDEFYQPAALLLIVKICILLWWYWVGKRLGFSRSAKRSKALWAFVALTFPSAQ